MPWLPDNEDVFGSGVDPSHSIEVIVTDNPVVGQILGPDGSVLIEVRERQPIGFRANR